MRIKKQRTTAFIATTALILGALAGAAFASTVVLDNQGGVSAVEGGEPAEGIKPDYPLNDAGQSFGSINNILPEDEPDLILVVAINGEEGYVDREELAEVTGANVANPAEAVEWQRQQDAATWDSISIPVYENDGRTVVGSFEVTRSIVDYKE